MAAPRIVGSETEYGLTVQNDPDFDSIATSLLLVNSYSSVQSLRLLWDYDQEDPLVDARGFELDEEYDVPDQQDNMAINKVLPNGARFYVDHAHPEFSTPECSNVFDLLRYEKAGERILNLSRMSANQHLPSGRTILVYKNNSDQKGNSYGYHENYLMDRRTPFQTIAEQLMPFLVTRQIFCGAGKVGAENGTDPVPYQISQRADFFETEIGLDTMVKRPIINTRDEPHANRDRFRRLHVIVGDANMSEYTTYLKVGTTLVVLQMIEDGALALNLTLDNPVQALRAISHDPTCKITVALKDGRKMTAIDIQRCFHEAACRYLERHGPCHPTFPQIVAEWGSVLERLATDPMQLHREIDWVMKLHLLLHYMERRGSDWDDPRIAMMDLQYHDIRPEKGLYYVLERSGGARRLLTEADIQRAIDDPPEDTRAYFRGQCLKKFRQQVFGVNWDSISFNLGDGPIKRIMMEDPTRGTKQHVQELLDRSQTAAELIANLVS
ncbi:MAG: proteasome accessory factor PafA2 [Candidatus Tectimicrobiota bacterium]|nr:MAG: proteasome accessory factor PafA2 [Candidatus Tectomicrobia bacterium]